MRYWHLSQSRMAGQSIICRFCSEPNRHFAEFSKCCLFESSAGGSVLRCSGSQPHGGHMGREKREMFWGSLLQTGWWFGTFSFFHMSVASWSQLTNFSSEGLKPPTSQIRWLELRDVFHMFFSQVFLFNFWAMLPILPGMGGAAWQVFEPYFQAILDFLPVPWQRTAKTEGRFAMLAASDLEVGCEQHFLLLSRVHYVTTCWWSSVWNGHASEPGSMIRWFILPKPVHIPIHLQRCSLLAK